MTLIWACCHTEPRQENRAKRELQFLGYIVYLPVETKFISHARIKKKTARSLFSNYLFVQISPHQPWAEINRTPGVNRLLTNNSAIATISYDYICALNAAELSGLFDESIKILNSEKGTKLNIVNSLFRGHIAELVKAKSAQKVEILIKILGTDIKADLPVDALRLSA